MANVIDQQFITTPDTAGALRYDTTVQIIAQQFTPTKTTVSQVDLNLSKSGTPSGNVWVEIWSDTGANLPNAQIGADSTTIATSAISTTAYHTFTFATPITVTPGTKYWITFHGSYTISTSNLINWARLGAGGYAGGIPAANNGSAWSTSVYGTTTDFNFKEYYLQLPSGNPLFFTNFSVG